MDSSPIRSSINNNMNLQNSNHSRASSNTNNSTIIPPTLNANKTDGLDASLKVLSSPLLNIVNEQHLDDISLVQEEMKNKLKLTIEESKKFNEYSNNQFQKLSTQFELHTLKINKLQIELETIFRRIRNIKHKLCTKYPTVVAKVQKKFPDIEVEDD